MKILEEEKVRSCLYLKEGSHGERRKSGSLQWPGWNEVGLRPCGNNGDGDPTSQLPQKKACDPGVKFYFLSTF